MRSRSVVIFIIVVIIIAVIAYVVLQDGNKDLYDQERFAKVISDEVIDAQEALGKIGETSDLNPVGRTNPFSDSYRNPFE